MATEIAGGIRSKIWQDSMGHYIVTQGPASVYMQGDDALAFGEQLEAIRKRPGNWIEHAHMIDRLADDYSHLMEIKPPEMIGSGL